jgi:hypothetical protein
MRRGIVNKFNRGEIDRRAFNRDDVTKVNNSCALMENFTPMRLGPMQYRPGSLYLGSVANPSYLVPFVAATTDTAVLAFTDSGLSIWVDDTPITRAASTLTLANQIFDSDIASWNDTSGVGSVAVWATGGYASLTGAQNTSAKLNQTFGGVGIGVEQAIRITVLEAPVNVKIGESGADSTEIFNGDLGVGTHSLVFTPTAALPTITLTNSKKYRTLVSEVSIEAAGELSLPLPATISDIQSIRYAQSADVVFVGNGNTVQFKIERRGIKSWGIAEYRPNDGPFGLINNTDITLTAADLTGNTTLTASDPLFSLSSVGTLYRLTSAGQEVTASVTAEDSGTNSIRVTGVGTTRRFTVSRSGSFSATVTLQRSSDDATWQDVEDYTTGGSKTYDDELDNNILYYRLWVKTGDYTSGTALLDLVYTAGSIDGVCRVTAYTSPTLVNVQVIEDFGSTDATRNWYEGEWTEADGYPSADAFYEGRLWWGGKNKVWSSVSDEFESFDSGLEGDSAAIRRTIGFGPVDKVEWLAPSSRLLMGLASDEIAIRSSSFGEVLSPSNTNLKSGSTQGAAPVEPIRIDDSVFYVQRSGVKIMDSQYSVDSDSHQSTDLMTLHPDICIAGIKRIAVSRQPETRVYVVLDDGSMRVYLFDPAEDVSAWSRITTDGTVEDVISLPGLIEDDIYILVSRTGGRYLEKLSKMGDSLEQHFDSALALTSPGTTITGLDHLEGKTVGVWADSQDRGTYSVASGSITVADSWTAVVVGLTYIASYKSNKLTGYKKGSSQGRRKRVNDLNLSMVDYWPGALEYGPSFDLLEAMPLIEEGTDVVPTALISEYDEEPFAFNGENEIDARICLRATAPCTILSVTYGVLEDGDTASPQE